MTLLSIEPMAQDSNTDSDISNKEFLEATNLAGARPKTKVVDRTATALPTRCAD